MATPYKNMTTPLGLRRAASALSSTSSEMNKEPVSVFCRIRPLDNENDPSCISLISPTVLSLNTPPKYPMQRETHARFKQIFTSYSTQKEVFDFVAMPLIQNLLKGKNGLLFSYGVTGSGKTFTLNGDSQNPGIMPRSIDTIFNTIGEFQAPKFTIKPDKMNGFEIQSENDAAQERLLEVKKTRYIASKNGRKIAGDRRQYINDVGRIIDVDESNLYSVFISYTEIYNNTVYDLLDESNGKSLQSRLLREDCMKNMYVSGVTEVEVKSAEEAFELLNLGQKRKRMGETILNSDSSRSHSIFNIRIVQLEQVAYNSDGQDAIPETNVLKVSQLSLVDLAGSERTNRTQASGTRLKEAGRINNSLMCLRTCLETLRENQMTGCNKLVPYRDSRLTFLFRSFFEGYGKVEMIVCVNPAIQDYEENLQVMKFAEITQDVTLKRKEHRDTPYVRKIAKKTPQSSIKKAKFTFSFTLPQIPSLRFNPDNIEDMGVNLQKIENILRQRRIKMENNFADYEIPENNFRRKLQDVTESNVIQISEIKNLKTALNEERQKTCNLKEKLTDLELVNDSISHKNNELLDVIRSLRHQIDEKDLKINQKILEKEKTKRHFATAKENMTHELDMKLRKQREHLRSEMLAKDEKLKRVKEILDSNEPVRVPQLTPPAVESSILIDLQNRKPTASSTPANRHRRSRSVGDVWVEHNAIKPVPLGTVLQPFVRKRKSLTKLSKATDITNRKQSKYCLIAQDQDSDGDIETKVYKADIVPTCGGGAQVIFNDVELLRQMSPTDIS